MHAGSLKLMTIGEKFSLNAARQFAEKYKDATSEKQLAQTFWRDFFVGVCGVSDVFRTGIEFEHPVKVSDEETSSTKFIDVLWPSVLLIEHKSAGFDLDKAEQQARNYLVALDANKRPPVFLVSDFARIRIIEVFAGTTHEFKLEDLPDNLNRFEAILASHTEGVARQEVAADEHAATLMSNLYVAFEGAGYGGHEVSIFLVRVLFLLFGDDTRMWRRNERGLFEEVIRQSADNGSGLGGTLQELFQILDTPIEKRPGTLNNLLVDFPYINGGLFAETLPVFSFNKEMREALREASLYDWSKISPAIFGAMLQTIKSKEARRELGEHYTSASNVRKVIGEAFLNDLNEKLHKGWTSAPALKKLRLELGQIKVLDPACGSGNFIILSYTLLRELELKITARLQELEGKTGALQIDGSLGQVVQLNHFAGIEYEEWSSSIANTAMLLAQHQANLQQEEIIGSAPNPFPLKQTANIVHGNALQINWAEVIDIDENTVIVGNPPFYGSTWQNAEQKTDTAQVWKGITGSGLLDYVSNWYLIAARHMEKTNARAAFVSTNSITQGVQPSIIWGQIMPMGIGIDFAHRSFAWSNGSGGQAGVHCVIIGFSKRQKPNQLALYNYPNAKGEAVLTWASNINAYLLDAPNVIVSSRSRPLNPNVPVMDNGSKPADGGNLSDISPSDADEIKATDPIAAKYLRRTIGARELIHNEERYCLWLVGAEPGDLRTSPVLSKRIQAVREMRQASSDKTTQKDANNPTEFQKIRQPLTDFIAVPQVSSEEREYVPMAILPSTVIVNNRVSFVSGAGLDLFGMLISKPFNLWTAVVSGRLESRLNLSNNITYNNFPFPELTDVETDKVGSAAKAVLDARAAHPQSTLADLYDRNAMPADLRKAHDALDKAVLGCFSLKHSATDVEVLSEVFKRYDEATRGLLLLSKSSKPRK
jgi:hypothetical protein